MKIVVTGAGGLIGSSAVHALYKSGYNVTALYRRMSASCEGFQWNSVKTDLLEEESEFALNSINPAIIIHCAAILPKQFEGKETEEIAKLNRCIDDRILNFCHQNECILIYTSSASVYGGTDSPWSEESPVALHGAYVREKFKTEESIQTLKNRAVILRISAPYGPQQKIRTVLRIFIERALANLDLQYYGSGERQQDFIAAEDVAQAIVCAVSHKDAQGVFNIASGKSISMRSLAELVVTVVPGTSSKVIASGLPDLQEEFRAFYEIHKARNILGWTPSVSLEQGIRRWVQYLEAYQ